MRLIFLLIVIAFISCHDPNYKISSGFKQLIPDTSKTWAGRMTKEVFLQTRNLQEKFHLDSLEQGTTTGKEIRVWHLSALYDPQVLQIVRQSSNGECSLRILSFDHSKQDSILQDIKRRLTPGLLDSTGIVQLWRSPSQSEMANGDSYGCADGSDLFIELANTERYKILWYRCPDSNKEKNEVFQLAIGLAKYFNENMLVK